MKQIWLVPVSLCLSLLACAPSSNTNSMPTAPIYSQNFDTGSDFTINNTSQTIGPNTGVFSGSVSAGQLFLSASATLTGIGGAGPSGSGQAELTANVPTLEANKAYAVSITYKTDPGGWVTLSRSIRINGVTYPLSPSATFTTTSVTFASGPSGSLVLAFAVSGGDDMGAAPSANLWVDSFVINQQ